MLTEDQFIDDTEAALEMFTGGYIVEAFETLQDLGYDIPEIIDMMQTHDPDIFDELNGELK